MLKQRMKNKFLALGTVTVFLLTQILSIQVLAVETPGLGDLVYQESVTFAPGTTVNTYVANHPANPKDREQAYTIEFKPSDQKVKLVTNHGSKLYNLSTLTQHMNSARSEGYNVIGGINGDYFGTNFNLQPGVPVGHEIHKGRLTTANHITNYETIGFTAEGAAFIDTLDIDISLGFSDESSLIVNRLNKDLDNGICVFDDMFAGSTRSSKTSLNIICDITEGRPSIMGITTLKVIDIKDNAQDVVIPAGKMVISMDVNTTLKPRLAKLRTVKVGHTLTLEFKTKDTNKPWSEVQEAISGRPLVRNGAVVEKEGISSIHPRTTIGVKADGTVVIFVVDGRQQGYSEGMNLIDIGNYLISQQVIDAVNLDGGGSTTIAARLPGDSLPTVMNSPSDGGQRATGNALILVSNVTGDGSLANLHINPVKSILLAGASTDFSVKGTDNAYEPVTLPGAPEWSVNGSIGTIDSNGRFTAGPLPGNGSVAASVGGKTEKADIQIVNDADLKFNVSELYMNPGESFDLNVSATWNGIPVSTADNTFNWTVEGNIGTVDPNGIFKAVSAVGLNGKVKAAKGAMSCEVIVNVGKEPVIIEDFEDGIIGWKAADANLPDTNVMIYEEANEDFVRFGNKSLKLVYDMTGGSSTTVGAYVDATPAVLIEGYPTHIGMWVYGDNKNHWLRGQLLDGNDDAFYIDFTYVNWEGWKYVEAPIPTGKTMPLKLDMPVRYMETNQSKVSSGVLYVDNIRAVYKYKNDDLIPPVIGQITPADGSFIKGSTNISVQVSDNQTGINPGKIKFFVDDQLKTDIIYNAVEGSVQWNTRDLAEGNHKFTLKVKDNFGNEAVKEWYLTVDLTPPVTEAAIDKTEFNGWYNSNINLTLTAKDNNPESCKTEYRLSEGSPWITYVSPIAITNDGIFTIQYHSTDKAGNQEAVKERKVQMDKTLPSFTLESVGESVYSIVDGGSFDDYRVMTFKVSDNLSGISSAKIAILNLSSVTESVYTIDPSREMKLDIDFKGRVGSYKAIINVADIAGNNLQREILFSVTTSTDSMNKLINAYQDSKDLKGPLAPQLENSLKQAEFFANQTQVTTMVSAAANYKKVSSDNYKQAIKHMQDFIKHLNNPALQENISGKAKQVLNADAEVLIKQWTNSK